MNGTQGTRPIDLGAAFAGTWTIPICYDSSGEAITQAGTNKGRTYPCSCGSGGVDTGPFAVGLLSPRSSYES
jgi:hypothetical protein